MGRIAFTAGLLVYCSLASRADEPPKLDLRPPLEFKDLTPPKLPEHGVEKHESGCAWDSHAKDEHGAGAFFGTAEYLLLRPRRGAFDFALVDPNRDLVPSGSVQSLNYELRSGVRVGIGYLLAESLWDAKFEYTYLGSGADRTVSAPAGGTLYATLTRPGLNDEANTASATAGLQYNLFDAVLGRRVILDERTAARIYGGIRFATIRQSFQTIYNGGDANQGLVSTNSNFDGFGPLAGGELTWTVCNGFHLYGRGSAALITGRLGNPINETNNGGRTLYGDLQFSERRIIPVMSLGLGLGWQADRVSIRAGYEITNWFGLIDTPRFSGELSEGKFTTRPGDLSLEGLFVQIGLAF